MEGCRARRSSSEPDRALSRIRCIFIGQKACLNLTKAPTPVVRAHVERRLSNHHQMGGWQSTGELLDRMLPQWQDRRHIETAERCVAQSRGVGDAPSHQHAFDGIGSKLPAGRFSTVTTGKWRMQVPDNWIPCLVCPWLYQRYVNDAFRGCPFYSAKRGHSEYPM
ncbi:uncharacterized protein LAESUDRAFT_340905 [Laetiporus sulphureus 93-53]|uniref:Uncharacterized protein n=1 Tax=Laetiporus sulphureus 93-53 TaxID=1314785 RepID=A0A165GP66_9APHY|nr:uncharacterized protein LAESUDRAFT_340905 [Laetiporus sulphureus 93-53]KZT10616.1 hypothetical protein LAESUDRAFT_340905 [Laetiporus sulphureus 93-53]